MLVKPVLNIIKTVLPKRACLAESVRLMIDEYSLLKNVMSSAWFTLFLRPLFMMKHQHLLLGAS